MCYVQQAQQLLIVLEVWWSTDSYFLKALLAIAFSSLTLLFAILQAISMVVNVGIHPVIIHAILSINPML